MASHRIQQSPADHAVVNRVVSHAPQSKVPRQRLMLPYDRCIHRLNPQLLTGRSRINVEVSGLRGFSRRSARLPGWASEALLQSPRSDAATPWTEAHCPCHRQKDCRLCSANHQARRSLCHRHRPCFHHHRRCHHLSRRHHRCPLCHRHHHHRIYLLHHHRHL